MFARKRDTSGRFSNLPSASMVDRFMSQVAPEPISGCWLWAGAPKNKFGHGAFKLGNRSSKVEFAHRVSYEIHFGEITSGLVVRHLCNNPACVNPAHLACGTQKENMHDKFNAGTVLNGERHYLAKATDSLVREMRSCQDRAKAILIGVAAGISRQASHDIMSGRTWKHVS